MSKPAMFDLRFGMGTPINLQVQAFDFEPTPENIGQKMPTGEVWVVFTEDGVQGVFEGEVPNAVHAIWSAEVFGHEDHNGISKMDIELAPETDSSKFDHGQAQNIIQAIQDFVGKRYREMGNVQFLAEYI